MSSVTEQATDMVNIEVDGVPMQAPKNSMIIEATDRAGISVPRFCYHHKLSIAANCRMCLVDVEKAPKPLPACATPVMDGMKVYTRSRRAIDAQHGVMEFLLINHPLDCPICDQGGECELQDLAMGYGRSISRFSERKRVVKDKNVGPLIQTDMTRCIHCTRCVRFLEEIAGTSEMGGTGRGDRMEIGTCIERSIESELSGNIIDVCPVGALTNKPFRYSARAWELESRASVANHDGVGSSLYYHVRAGRILRAVPREQEARNEAWLSDRDRYAHFGLYSDDRVLNPRIREQGKWRDATWEEGIAAAAKALSAVVAEHGPDALGVLMSPSALNEEYLLVKRLTEGLGCPNMDHRLRETDFRDDAVRSPEPRFDCSVADLEAADAIVLLGSNIRHEAPILGHRVRKAWRAGAAVHAINPLDWAFHFDLASKELVAPQHMVGAVAGLALAVQKITKAAPSPALAKLLDKATVDAAMTEMAQSLVDAEQAVLLLGQASMAHPQAASLRLLAAWIAEATQAALNMLPFGGNANGAGRSGFLPAAGKGLNAAQMMEQPRQAYLLWDFEPDFDIANPARATAALNAASSVVAVSSFATSHLESVADVILPLAPLAESEGSLVDLQGQIHPVRAAGRLGGQARPGWKILRRLGAELGLDGFDQVDLEQVQAQLSETAQPVAANDGPVLTVAKTAKGLHRIGEVPMYGVDALCRRSSALQSTSHADSMFVALNPADAKTLKLQHDDQVSVSQGQASVDLPLRVTDQVPVGGAWLRSSTCATCHLGDSFGVLEVAPAKGAN